MNLFDFEILKSLYSEQNCTQRKLSELTKLSLGRVNKAVGLLKNNGYINESLQITSKADMLIKSYKPASAIILAAGHGLRMIPLCQETPKGLLEVRGELLIERLIRQLHKVGITDIYVVVGYMKEKFEYLIDKFGVQLVVNPDYSGKNSLHSLSLVADKINNSYIIPCDVWCRNNPFSTVETYSWYMVSNLPDQQSTLKVNRNGELIKVNEANLGNKEIGIAYVGYDKANIVRDNISKLKLNDRYDSSFWESAVCVNNKMILNSKVINNDDVFEINSYEDLIKSDANSKSLESEYIDIICNSLHINRTELYNIESLKAGMTNRSFLFNCAGHKYIFRIPGEGTDKLIDRQKEYAVYQQIKDKGICDDIIYINPVNGYKITKFIEDSRNCDAYDETDVKRCMAVLKGFHDMSLSVDHTFDIFGQIEYYEQLRDGESMYDDYDQIKKNVLSLQDYIKKQPKKFCLTHIDAVPDNFIISQDAIHLIDWEYAAMQDPHVDIAMFAIYALYDRAHIDALIDTYFDNKCSKAIRLKIYCYVAACGLLWSNWCEYKHKLGVDFGEYSLRQYRYAKEFCQIFEEEINNE